MKKDTMRGMVGLAILLVLYILVVFLVPFAHTAVFWLSVVFTLVAFAVTGGTVYIALIKKGDAKSRFYGFPIAKIGVTYGLAQLIAGLVMMALGEWIFWWVAVLVYAIGLGATVIGLIGAETVVEEIQIQDEKLKKDVTVMRGLQSKVSQMAAQCQVAELEKFADEMRYCDPVSSEGSAEAERELSALVDELQAAVVNGEEQNVRQLCRKASAALAERNRLCKLSKK